MSENNPDWQLRFYREGDIPALAALINSTVEKDSFGQSYSEADLAANYSQPFSDPPNQILIAEGPQVEGVPAGVPPGMARILWMDDPDAGERIYQMQVLIHPAARELGLESLLVPRVMEIIRANEAGADLPARDTVDLIGMAWQQDTFRRGIYTGLGMHDVRHMWTMERSLDHPLPEPREVEGVSPRIYIRPEDNTAGCEAYNKSFIDHYGFHLMSQEQWDHYVTRPSARPDLSWVAIIESGPDAGKIAGFCMCEIDEYDNEQLGKKAGWIGELGVIRGWRGLGLGRSLLLQGMRSLRDAGLDTAMLGVDTENPSGATRLYDSVGFTVRDSLIVYKCALKDVLAAEATR
ncbi:MAG TPA: GNAT family N-acetyltransferase [Chloroflexia bacterium]|nr:GNAT family N-acetyltransferase [Chloroflexia bacterium]